MDPFLPYWILPYLYPVATYLTIYVPIRVILELSSDHEDIYIPKTFLLCIPLFLIGCNSSKYCSTDGRSSRACKVHDYRSGEALCAIHGFKLGDLDARSQERLALLDQAPISRDRVS